MLYRLTLAISGAAPAKGHKAPNNQNALYASTTSEQPETWGRLRCIASLDRERNQRRQRFDQESRANTDPETKRKIGFVLSGFLADEQQKLSFGVFAAPNHPTAAHAKVDDRFFLARCGKRDLNISVVLVVDKFKKEAATLQNVTM